MIFATPPSSTYEEVRTLFHVLGTSMIIFYDFVKTRLAFDFALVSVAFRLWNISKELKKVHILFSRHSKTHRDQLF